ncbi:MAG: hypothetical protein NZ898_16915, partial [Myxococcota bacterium]|nr:hypothetical protein [Myxococcota bacterium]
TLAFRPSGDIGRIAGATLADRSRSERGGWLVEQLLRRAAQLDRTLEADFASFLFFDASFARRLIELGRRDALDRADEIRAFFAR